MERVAEIEAAAVEKNSIVEAEVTANAASRTAFLVVENLMKPGVCSLAAAVRRAQERPLCRGPPEPQGAHARCVREGSVGWGEHRQTPSHTQCERACLLRVRECARRRPPLQTPPHCCGSRRFDYLSIYSA